MTLLSILIPTTPDRERETKYLVNKIIGENYSHDFYTHPTWRLECKRYVSSILPIEVLVYLDNKEMTIGEKRELLYKGAIGEYSFQIDSDDDIADNAIELILEAIRSNQNIPCITFREKCIINGEYKSSNHSIKYAKWQDNFDGFDFVRTPFYKDVIRTEIAKSVPFEHIRWNEDERFSYAIKPFLTDEIHIDEELYHYIHNSTNPQERYGLNRD